MSWLRVLAIAAVGLFIAFSMSACSPEDFTTWATVTSVRELEVPEPDQHRLYDDDLRVPPPHYQVDLRLEDGKTVSLEHNGERRYAPGERIKVLRDRTGALLL